jgi:hypothetical protein
MKTLPASSPQDSSGQEDNARNFQRAMLNILEDSDEEKTRLQMMQTAMS